MPNEHVWLGAYQTADFETESRKNNERRKDKYLMSKLISVSTTSDMAELTLTAESEAREATDTDTKIQN